VLAPLGDSTQIWGRCRTTPGWLDRRACLRSGPIRLRDTGLWGPTPVRLDLARRLHGVSHRVVDHHRFRRRSHMKWTKPEFEVVELGMEVGAYAGTAGTKLGQMKEGPGGEPGRLPCLELCASSSSPGRQVAGCRSGNAAVATARRGVSAAPVARNLP